MNIDGINVEKAFSDAEACIEKGEKEKGSEAWVPMMRILLVLLKVLFNQVRLNSKNSSKPPSSDFPSKAQARKKKDPKRSPGGQKGHMGTTLKPVNSPDHIKVLKIDPKTLPKGQYREDGYQSRQVIELITRSEVTEYRAQVLVDQDGHRFVAPFPKEVTRPIQYGASIKAHIVYLSQFQLIPVARIQAQFADQYNLPLSLGSISNFNREAYERLEPFEKVAKQALLESSHAHADETGLNVGGKRIWLHSFSTSLWSYFAPHEKRGCEAMDAIGIIPHFMGILCHDHWKSYYQYTCIHALCNAHHLRELQRAFEQDGQKWADKLGKLLLRLHKAVDKGGGSLSPLSASRWRQRYREQIAEAEIECPAPAKPKQKRRGRLKRTKSRNLLERLKNYEADVLRFMTDKEVPFTNNQGERDIRMTKVQQKISGCFRSMEGAQTFCLIRSYLSTCQKQNVTASKALNQLFNGEYPEFIEERLEKNDRGAE